MGKRGEVLWAAAPWRALLEGALVCWGLLIPMLPILLDSPPVPFSLYLVQLPLVCAAVVGLRMRFVSMKQHRWVAVLVEVGLAVVVGAGVLGLVWGLLVGTGHRSVIRHSYAGTWGTIFFLAMAGPEYLGIRVASWVWRFWDRQRRQRYVWGLTHAILSMVGGGGLLVLLATLLFLVNFFKQDITGIPPTSVFANAVFWLTMLLLLAFVLFVGGILLFLPPAMLFSFLVARRMTGRVESLARGAQALRAGNLGTRVDVIGEDEIAQLQADFNAMAADLEKSVQLLQTEKDKVWRLLEARRELVAGVSHELRNPTATILGYSEALRRGWQERSPEEVGRDLETIQYEAARLQTILNDLLTASQVEAGHLSLDLQALEVTPLAQRVVETFAGLAWSSKRVQVTLTAPEEVVLALADRLRLEQVLVNLVQNAVQHTSPGGLVAVEVHPEGERVRIEVEDTGEGIPPEDLAHVWEKYYQAGAPQRRSRYGMGLGLAVVKELTEAMGGTVAVESWPGQGSLFQICLPVYRTGEENPLCPEKSLPSSS